MLHLIHPPDWEVACSTSDRQGSNFESYVWRAVIFCNEIARIVNAFLECHNIYWRAIFIADTSGIQPYLPLDVRFWCCTVWSSWFIREYFRTLTLKTPNYFLWFSTIWNSVSLTRFTTSSEWKSFRFDKIAVNYFSNIADWYHMLSLTCSKGGT